tara:strand:- start:717 stop:3119 length:2403 start_codon:yes stop_codon:yes gene_type:complete
MGKIIGESFDPYVAKQIEVRQRKLGATTRDADVLTYTTSKTSWLRLTSGVNVDQTKLTELGRSNQTLTKNLLAESYVLFGAANNVSKSPEPKGGFLDSYSNLLTQNAAYGFNSTQDYGAVPLPGIESAEIVPKNRGSLREANITIKAFNREQFNIIETLYMRLKYSILLEWGHAIYFDNKETLITRPTDRVYKEFLSTKPIRLQEGQLLLDEIGPSANLDTFAVGNVDENANQNKILKLIKNQRVKSNGNYDGFLGWVTNFSWELSPHGVYTISLKAISYGDIIESLSITKPSILSPKDKKEDEEEQGSPLEFLLKRFKDLLNRSAYLPVHHTRVKDFADNVSFLESINPFGGEFKRIARYVDGAELDETFIKFLMGFQGVFYQPPSDLNFTTQKELLYSETRWIAFEGDKNKDQYYIKLGSLLRIINNFFLIYDYSNPANPPLSSIDYDYDSTFCSIPKNIVSTDPLTCIIPSNISFTRAKLITGYTTVFSETEVEEINLKRLNSYTGTDFLDNSDENKAKPLHIHVNFDFIIAQLKNNLDENGDLALYDFLSSILKGINTALAGTIDLGVYYDEETNVYSIIDNNPPIKPFTKSKSPNPTEINVKGIRNNFGSFAKSFSIKSEISNKFATQIAIGAQASNTSLGSNSIAFNKWNEGLEDRIIFKKSYSTNPITTANTSATSPVDEANVIVYVQKLNTFIQLPKLEDLKSHVVNYLKIERDIEVQKGNLLSKSFIPISLNLELDGLSGIKLFQKYTINDEILPKNYKNSIEFLTKGLRHSIDQSGWTTSIEGLSIPKQK